MIIISTFIKIFKNSICIFLIQILIFFILAEALIFHGPFVNIKEFIVNTAMTTFKHQYLATAFLSNKEIKEILDKNKVDTSKKNTDVNAIQVSNMNDEYKQAIDLVNISNGRYKGYLLIVHDPSRVSIGVADKIGQAGMQLVDIVKESNALAGINSGGFGDEGGHGNGGVPVGLLIKDGEVLYGKPNQKYEMIGLNEDSVLILGNYTIEEAKKNKIRDAVTFTPFLIVNGETMIKHGDGGWGLGPRTVIGQTKEGAILMLVIDGRQVDSVGATLKEAQDIMLKYGAYNAANLDGGASTTLVYQNEIVNKPCSIYGPRSIPSAFIVR